MRKVRVRIFAPNDHPSRVIGLFPFSPSSHRTKRRYYSLIRVIATTRLPLAFAQLRDRLMLKTGSTRRVPAPGVIISGQSGLLIALMEESARNEISCNVALQFGSIFACSDEIQRRRETRGLFGFGEACELPLCE